MHIISTPVTNHHFRLADRLHHCRVRTYPIVKSITILTAFAAVYAFSSIALSAPKPSKHKLSKELRVAIRAHAGGEGLRAFKLPLSHQYRKIPQDPNNKLTANKVNLGKFLFHETGFGLNSQDESLSETYSCASCHHVAAGFKSGIAQGLGEGGSGFGNKGQGRVLAHSHMPGNPGDVNHPDGFVADFQPIASPTILNSAYQDMMLWNGAFGNSAVSVNKTVDTSIVKAAGPAHVFANDFGLSGLETQAIAGTKVHRLKFTGSILQTNKKYKRLYRKAFPRGITGIPPGSEVDDIWLGSALAIAAYERTVLANQAPFQKWLRGNTNAMSRKELRGGLLFFGKAGCVACHTGPALSSKPDATESRIFFNVGFDDLDESGQPVHGVIDQTTKQGRGGFTGRPEDDYKFKITQLYNLIDSPILGHGASFSSVRDVVEYKNDAQPQHTHVNNLASEFTQLYLTEAEIVDLVAFIEEGLYDKRLSRYAPGKLPSGNCFPVADFHSAIDLGCL